MYYRTMVSTLHHVVLVLLASNLAVLAAASTGTLLAGQTLPQVTVHPDLHQQSCG